MEGKKVLLKVLPMKGLMRFGKKGKLSLRFIASLEVFERVGKVAYRFALPPSLARVHPVFHFRYFGSTMKKSHVLDFSTVQLDEKLTYEEELVVIVDRQVQKLRSKDISSVKVLWKGQQTEEGYLGVRI
ncbi:uncharacterized protein [Nicotiana tomentosiformis]|uniref:Tf2-1-like SH3-like domain-containing protein n=1 Tax=Nicotiana tabacum TaxID=4097 RepID=A0A1S4B0J9_TOBAC|nr:PREDICTED: uncharacterized protein LOC107803235 [Nicotiana tabacum]